MDDASREDTPVHTKKLLGLIASQRRVGNSEITVKAVAGHMPEGWELHLIRLGDLRIAPCRGCYSCLLPGRGCKPGDDFAWFVAQLVQADAVLVSSPDYVLGPVGIWKMLADRSLQAASHHLTLSHKRAAAILTLGKEHYRGYADTALIAQAKALGLSIGQVACFLGTYPGEVALEEDFEAKTRDLAAYLGGDGNGMPAPRERCPVCLSDLFRIHTEGWECALCCSLLARDEDGLTLLKAGTKFTEAGIGEHLVWLAEKKKSYKRMRETLNRIMDAYRGGIWLHPTEPEDPEVSLAQ